MSVWASEAMSRFLNLLRSWLVMVSVIALGNTVQSFHDHSFMSEKLYTGTPDYGEKYLHVGLRRS